MRSEANGGARKEGEGRVWYTAMGHREDVWTNPVFQQILVGGIKWALGEAKAEVPANLKTVAPGAHTNPAYFESPPPKPKADPAKAKKSGEAKKKEPAAAAAK